MKKWLMVLVLLTIVVGVGCNIEKRRDFARGSMLYDAREAYLDSGGNDFGFVWGEYQFATSVAPESKIMPWYAESNSDGLITVVFIGGIPETWIMNLNLVRFEGDKQWRTWESYRKHNKIIGVETQGWFWAPNQDQVSQVKGLIEKILACAKAGGLEAAMEVKGYRR
jgi:hypothetical protein